ncbi:Arginine--tRNA ligase [Dissostichus eleginoides]|uniref:Arginine--tRNA ligase n=1 Tax=Dissostichus eleginoides TaxID=100907 RepID=A0AAD9C021_DISEL|nr:Arginine--tRNA ligase [Dissostichus eleginoides]
MGALSAVDKTMEETFMRFAKSSGGFTGLYSQFGAYQRWCRTTSTRAQFYQKILEMVDLIKDPDCPRAGKHRELEKAEVKKDKDRLYSLPSGAPVLMEVEMDVLQAETVGKAAKAEFIKRLQSREPGKGHPPWDTRWVSKTNKAALLHYILEDTTPKDLPYPKDALFIQDGMALLHVLTNLPPTCGEICLQVLDQMVAKKHFLFSTDSYHPGSIKAQERLRRGSSEKIILAGPATRKPYDFKMFLTNDDNKKQLCQLLLRVWSDQQAASRLERTEMAVLIVEGRAHQLLSSNGKVEVREPPQSTATRKRLIQGWYSTFIMLLPLESLGEDYCATLLGFHVFSGEDCTCAFKGKGKVGPLKKLEKNPKFHRAFSQLGDNRNVKPEVLKQLEQFTCLIYGESRESSVDVVRAKLLRKMVGQDDKLTAKSKVDLARLPPCDALKPHVQRVNHRVALYKGADESILEKPNPYDEEQGWMRTDGVLRPGWSCGPVLPTSLVDLLDTTEREQEDEEEEEFDSDDSIENND